MASMVTVVTVAGGNPVSHASSEFRYLTTECGRVDTSRGAMASSVEFRIPGGDRKSNIPVTNS